MRLKQLLKFVDSESQEEIAVAEPNFGLITGWMKWYPNGMKDWLINNLITLMISGFNNFWNLILNSIHSSTKLTEDIQSD